MRPIALVLVLPLALAACKEEAAAPPPPRPVVSEVVTPQSGLGRNMWAR